MDKLQDFYYTYNKDGFRRCPLMHEGKIILNKIKEVLLFILLAIPSFFMLIFLLIGSGIIYLSKCIYNLFNNISENINSKKGTSLCRGRML